MVQKSTMHGQHSRGPFLEAWAAGALVVAFLIFPLFVTLPFPQHVAIKVLLYITMGQAWNIIGGYGGQLSFAHAVFFGLGSYTSSLLLVHFGLTPWLGMLAGMGVAALISLAVSYPCFRLRGHYFAMATIAFGEIMHISFLRWKLVGGALGVSLPQGYIPSLYYFMWGKEKIPYYYAACALAAVSVGLVWLIDRTRFGMYLKAIQQDEEAMANLGLNTEAYKLAAMALSAALTAAAGTFHAQYVLYIDPDSVMTLLISVMIVVVTLFGGRGTVWGPVLGALILIPLSEYTRTLLGGFGQGLDFILFGLAIVLLSRYEPRGLVVIARRLAAPGQRVRPTSGRE